MALLTNTITVDGDYDFRTNFRMGTLFCAGTFGGGTMTFKLSCDGVNYVPVTDGEFTADYMQNFISGGTYGRLTLSGATNPNISVRVDPIFGH